MRWFLMVCFIMSGLAAFGSEWGLLWYIDESADQSSSVQSTVSPTKVAPEDLSEESGDERPLASSPENYSTHANSLLRDVLNGKPVSAAVVLEEDVPQPQSYYEEVVRSVYQEWFLSPVQYITNKKREKEFQDILPMLQQSISVQFTHPDRARIVFHVASLNRIKEVCEKSWAAGCHLKAVPGQPEHIWLSSETQAYELALHEVGHSLSLSDQYRRAADQNTHPAYHSVSPGDGVMNSDYSRKLSCDDVDGLINAIDVTRKIDSPRNQRGWKSFCARSKGIYAYGKPVENRYQLKEAADNQGWYVIDLQSPTPQKTLFPWDDRPRNILSDRTFSDDTVFVRDTLRRPIRARGFSGAQIYYAYPDLYTKTQIRLVTRDGKVVQVEKTSLAAKKQIFYQDGVHYTDRWDNFRTYSLHARNRDQDVQIQFEYNLDDGRGSISYTEKNNADASDPSSNIEFMLLLDQKGAVAVPLEGVKLQTDFPVNPDINPVESVAKAAKLAQQEQYVKEVQKELLKLYKERYRRVPMRTKSALKK
ncbi:MAG: hypothetical protein IKN49_07005 [Elusimicrobiaceae bacterium]|nr:hypothetical protein [Elusimicrobiaceae bacterium]